MNTGTAIITVGALALFVSTVYAFIAFLRLVAGKVWSSVVLQLIVWAVGIACVFLFGASQLGKILTLNIDNNAFSLRTLDTPTKLIIGFNIASIASLARDALTAWDHTTSVALPALFWPQRTTNPAPAPVPPAVDPGPPPPAPPAQAPTQPAPPPQAR